MKWLREDWIRVKHTTHALRTAAGKLCTSAYLTIVLFVCCFTAFSWLAAPARVDAAVSSPITLSASVGFSGFYNKYSWVPVHLTVANRGPATHVVLQVTIDGMFDQTRNANANLEWRFSVPAKQSATRDIAVPGWVLDSDATLECWVGNQLVASMRLSGNEVGRAAFVGVLSPRGQAAQFLTGATDGVGGLTVLPVAIDPAKLPTEPTLLGSLSAISATPQELDGLDAAHRSTLVRWVQTGGVLLVTGTTPNLPDWASMFPLVPGPAAQVSPEELARFTGISTGPASPVVIHADGVKTGAEVWVGTDSHPAVASLVVGRGRVVQTAFSPLSPAMLAWPSNPTFWSEVLAKGAETPASALPPGLTAKPLDALLSASSALAPLRVPSLRLWGAVFGFYVLLVGPIAFLLLKRFRIEPWAWWILPVVSLFTTGVLYGVGSTQRPSGVLTDSVGVVDLIGNGSAEDVNVRSFASPRSTMLDVHTPSHQLVLPLVQGDARRLTNVTVTHADGTTVRVQNSGRWVVHDLISSGSIGGQGSVTLQVWTSGGTLSGTVVNHTPYHLEDGALLWDGKMVELGSLAPGETLTLDQKLPWVKVSGSTYLSAYGNYNHNLTRGLGRSVSSYTAEQGLLAVQDNTHQVLMVATTTDALHGLLALSSATRVSTNRSLALVREVVDVPDYPSEGLNPND